jgi:thiamine biosynthesis lipoprotein
MLGERAWSVWSCDAHLLVTDPAAIDDAAETARRRLDEVGDACDRFRPDSELRRICAGVATEVSPILGMLVRTALDTAERTGGLCDPTVGRLVKDIGYDRDIRLVLDDDRPVRVVVRPRRSWQAVDLDGLRLTVPEGVELDLGAAAKAFAADLIAQQLAGELGCGVLMNLGGDIATAGDAPIDGWQVRVQDLPGDPVSRVALHPGFALATSSTQRRTWVRGGRRLHHIVDPRTGLPASTAWRTVSVVAPTAVHANGETTAAIVAGQAAVQRLGRSGLAARLVGDDGTVHTLGGWPDDVQAVA